MTKTDRIVVHRRGFLGMVLPACAMTCLALESLPLSAAGRQAPGQTPAQPPSHPFDAPLPVTPTFRQMIRMQNQGLALFAVHLTKALGRERSLGLLQEWGDARAVGAAKNRAQRLGTHDFAALKKMFTPGARDYANSLVFEVAESTETVHELKVTECLWANTWREAGAGEEGFATICHGDYAFARAFNPDIEMVRDQTLMQGRPCCNHRYLWKG